MNTFHNAGIQLLATAPNKCGVAAVLAAMIAPAVNGNFGTPVPVAFGCWR